MPTSGAEPLLAIEGLEASYGKIAVLHGVDLHVGGGEIVTLLGPNGAGKTTLLRAISGLLPVTAGNVRFDHRELGRMTPREISRLGLAHVIEGHRVFTQQTVTDNLLLAGYNLPRRERKARIEEALSYFPEIAAKRHQPGSALSGGQQQMLAVAQGLVRRPKLLLLDEPSAGLSPVLVDRVLDVMVQLTALGTAVLLVEQLVDKALAASNRVYALDQGRVALHERAGEPGLRRALEQVYLGQPIEITDGATSSAARFRD
ncbi:MAG: ABC transporter ATP-binding protein [Alphaproteobacteria bacterium]|nr:ABC transporter ATP-binding protein [Alphaproteobacteria bacterium]